jgi:hypothetical protein
MYDFYKKDLLNGQAYCGRDLAATSRTYHHNLEKILRKCTQARTEDFRTSNKFYHSYKELRRDIEQVMNSTPTIVREENVKVMNAFRISGVMLALTTVFTMLFVIYNVMAFRIAQASWKELVSDYNETLFYRLEQVSRDLISTAPANVIGETYDNIARFTYADEGEITEYEAELLVDLLSQIDQEDILSMRIDEIMKYASAKRFKEISTSVLMLELTGESVGYDLAKAIFDVEVGKTQIASAYQTLERYQDNVEFYNAVIKLKNVLDNDENIGIIAEELDLTRIQVQEFLKNIRPGGTKP